MTYQQMGKTDFSVSDIILGTWKAGGTGWGAVNDFDSIDTIKYCVDSGVNLIDTATGYGYGRAERLIGFALQGEGGSRKSTAKVMTKWYLWLGEDDVKIRSVSPETQARSLAGSKARLGVDKLDIVLLHRDDKVTPIETAIETLAKFQSEGHISYIGVSNYSLEHLERAQKTAPLQMYQPPFSLLNTTVRDDGRLAFCRENGIAVTVYRVLGGGLLAPRIKDGDEYAFWDPRFESHRGPEFERKKRVHAELGKVAQRFDSSVLQLAVSWVLSHREVTCAIIGATTPEQAAHSLAASGKRLPQNVIDECEEIVTTA